MKLYEINAEIEALLELLEPDPETGEIPSNEDEIIDQLNALAMKREDILEYLAKLALDAKASAAAMKAEEKRLHERRQRMESKQEDRPRCGYAVLPQEHPRGDHRQLGRPVLAQGDGPRGMLSPARAGDLQVGGRKAAGCR